MPNSIDLATIEELKSWMGIQNLTTDDPLLESLITASSTVICNLAERNFAQATYTGKRYDGNGSAMLLLPEWPIISVSSLTINDVAIDVSNLIIDERRLILKSASGLRFTKGYANIVVSYTAGYTTIPRDLSQACCELTAYAYSERTRVGQVSKQLAGEVVSFQTMALPKRVEAIINEYRNVVPS